MILMGFRKVKGEWKRTGSGQGAGSFRGKTVGYADCAKRIKEVADLEDKVVEQERMITDLRVALYSALVFFIHDISIKIHEKWIYMEVTCEQVDLGCLLT
ncbi:hypothetical protein Droror1_Dr00021828 [Drosera rotundifolia]